MKIDVSCTLKELGGETDLKVPDGNGGKEVLKLSAICINALMHPKQPDKSSGKDKLRDYKLAMDLLDAEEVEMSTTQINKLKDKINDAYGPLVVGQAFLLLEGMDETKEE